MTPPPPTCQELRCSQPAVDQFNAGTDAEPLIYWLCPEHRTRAGRERWSAQSHGVFLIGEDAVLDTPKQVKSFDMRVADWVQSDEAGRNAGFVEVKLVLGYDEGPEHDEDRTILVPTDMAEQLGQIFPLMADQVRHRLA